MNTFLVPDEVLDLITAKSPSVVVGDLSLRFSRSPNETIFHGDGRLGRPCHLRMEGYLTYIKYRSINIYIYIYIYMIYGQ